MLSQEYVFLRICGGAAQYRLRSGKDSDYRGNGKGGQGGFHRRLYKFCGYKLIENWKNLAQLAYKLYNQCKNEEDAFELTTFMLGVDGEGEAVIVIDNNSTLRLLKNKSPIPILNIFDREEFNVIATILSHRPTNIIVVNPEKIEPSLMKAIHALGD